MVDNEDDLESTLQAAFDCGRTAVVDARVDPDENCYPMVPAGAARSTIIELPGRGCRDRRLPRGGHADEPPHGLRPAREQARRAGARLAALRAARLQHPVASRSGPTERPDISRLTLRVDCSEHSIEQIEKQMHKLVNVLRVTELQPDESVERELALITVGAPPDKRAELIALGEVFGGRAWPTSAATRSRSRSSGGRRSSTPSRSSCARTASASSRAPGGSACKRPGRARSAAAGTSLLSERNGPHGWK